MVNTLRSIFVWFYCLPISDAVWLMVFATFAFFLLEKLLGKYPWWKSIASILLIAWMAAVVYATIGNRDIGSTMQHNFIPFHSYREIRAGGNLEIYRSNFMNIVLFYPAGLLAAALLPKKWPWWSKILLTLVLFALVSAGIEYAQYTYSLGRVEIDDIIHNALGALLGAILGIINLSLPTISQDTKTE